MAFKLQAQNWHVIVSSDTTYFIASQSTTMQLPISGSLHMMYTDSVTVSGSDTFNHYFKTLVLPAPLECADTLGPPFMGYYSKRDQNGVEIFYQYFNNGFVFQTLAHTNDTWLMHTDISGIEFVATVESESIDIIDGVIDSIKTLRIHTFNLGLPVSSVWDNSTMVLSKHHGILKVIELVSLGTLSANNYTCFRLSKAFYMNKKSEFDKALILNKPGSYFKWSTYENMYNVNDEIVTFDSIQSAQILAPGVMQITHFIFSKRDSSCLNPQYWDTTYSYTEIKHYDTSTVTNLFSGIYPGRFMDLNHKYVDQLIEIDSNSYITFIKHDDFNSLQLVNTNCIAFFPSLGSFLDEIQKFSEFFDNEIYYHRYYTATTGSYYDQYTVKQLVQYHLGQGFFLDGQNRTLKLVQKGNGQNELLWQRTDNSFPTIFSVERSTDASQFNKLIEIPASSQIQSYSYIDYLDPEQAQSYFYRIVFLYDDGRIAYSNIVQSNVVPIHTKFICSPNPTSQYLDIAFSNEFAEEDHSLDLYNMNGEPLYHVTFTQNHRLLTYPFGKGLYFLKVDDDVRKIIIE